MTYNGVSNITENCTSDYQNAIEALIPSPRANIQKACTALFPTMVVELSIASSSINITSDEVCNICPEVVKVIAFCISWGVDMN